MINSILKTQPKLFCEQYWEKVLKETPKLKSNIKPTKVDNNFEITDINQMLVGASIPYYYWLKESLNNPLDKMVAQYDKEFKLLEPINEDKTLWRGIAEPSADINLWRLPRFEKVFNTQEGDTIYMPEYAFASGDKSYSESFMKNPHRCRGIIYKIFVPKGAKISRGSHYIFPRASKFECTGVKSFSEGGKDYKIINVNYINHDNISSDEAKTKHKNIFQRLFSKVNIF